MEIKVKKIRDVVEPSDGFRIYVDRFWPRGITKDEFKVDLWAHHVGPSAALMKWFHEDREGRFNLFSERYRQELEDSPDSPAFIEVMRKHPVVTFITDVHDVAQSHIPTLEDFVKSKLKQ